MNVSHKISEFRPLFSRNKEKIKLAQSRKMCTTPINTFLRKIEQISDILLISQKSGWSDLKTLGVPQIEECFNFSIKLPANQMLQWLLADRN